MSLVDGNLVSKEWNTALTRARKNNVRFTVNDGRRTMREQWARWRTYKAGGNLAAFPSPNAPHIRAGRIDHAVDVSSNDGGAPRLATWLRAHGMRATFPVGGEPWHIEVPAADLRRYHKNNKVSAYELSLRRRLRIAYAQKGPRGPALRRRIRTIKRRLRGIR